jgi:hypothetical protein
VIRHRDLTNQEIGLTDHPQHSSVSGGSRAPLRCAIAALIGLPILFYWTVLFTKTAHIPYDMEGFHYPLAAYIARCLRAGVLPLWDPFTYCGYPFHADMQTQLFYPPAWIPVLLAAIGSGEKLFYWYQWLIPLHMILGGVFSFCLLRALRCRVPLALLGALVYELGGFFASQAQHVGVICCGAWLPLSILAVIRLAEQPGPRWIALLSVSLCGAILAGFAASTAIVLITGAIVVLAYVATGDASWRLLLYYSAATIIAGMVCAVMLAPAWQLTTLSMASLRSQWFLTGGGLRLQSLVSLAIPNYYHIFTPFDPRQYKLPINFTFLYLYCGIIPLTAAVVGPWLPAGSRDARRFWVLTILSAFWMLGDATPVYRHIYSLLPPTIRGSLYAEYAMMPFCLFLGVTADLAIESLPARVIRNLSWALAIVTAADLMWFGSNRPMNTGSGSYRTIPTERTWQYGSRSLDQIRSLLGQSTPPERIDLADNLLLNLATAGRVFGIPAAAGDSPFLLLRIRDLRRTLGNVSPWERVVPVNKPLSPLLDLMSVRYLESVTPLDLRDDKQHKFERQIVDPGIPLYRNRSTLPRFFIVHRVTRAATDQDALRWVSRPEFRPADEAVIEASNADLKLGGDDTSTPVVQVKHYSANRIDLRIVSGSRALLVASEPFYPGWTARNHGKQIPILLADYAFRGVIVDSGVNDITFTYWPESFWLWIGISAVGIVGIAALLAGGRKAPARHPERRHDRRRILADQNV